MSEYNDEQFDEFYATWTRLDPETIMNDRMITIMADAEMGDL
jgi:hypothetical protein